MKKFEVCEVKNDFFVQSRLLSSLLVEEEAGELGGSSLLLDSKSNGDLRLRPALPSFESSGDSLKEDEGGL